MNAFEKPLSSRTSSSHCTFSHFSLRTPSQFVIKGLRRLLQQLESYPDVTRDH
jgi:hypothetical protein